MSDVKKLKNYHRSRRTGKIIETLEQKQKRHDAFLRLLDEKADEVLAGKHKNKPTPTDDELLEMRREKPEVGEVLDLIFEVAEKMK